MVLLRLRIRMIGHIRGKLIEKSPPTCCIDVQGIGYDVEMSMNCFFALPEVNSEVALHIHFVCREDSQTLYGFLSQDERRLFRLLIKINGVGPKLALAILSHANPDEFVLSILNKDTDSLVKLPGIGKKTAERLVIEMTDRLKDWEVVEQGEKALTPYEQLNLFEKEAISALVALGYKPQQASRAINQIKAEGLTCEDLIRLALRGMSEHA